jgi:hypothetical protein
MTPTCWVCGAVLDAGGYEPLVRWFAGTAVKKTCCNEPSIILCLWRPLVSAGWPQVYKPRDTQLERFVALKFVA